MEYINEIMDKWTIFDIINLPRDSTNIWNKEKTLSTSIKQILTEGTVCARHWEKYFKKFKN